MVNPPIAGPDEQGQSPAQVFTSPVLIVGFLGLALLVGFLLFALRRRKQADNNI
jgi:LPXTG-motif cell wall-anchored protein